MAKLLAIDGLNIVRRIYEASPEPDSQDKADNALRFSLSAFTKLQHEHAPTHLVAAFDFGGLTWRHALYPSYRAHRAPMPKELRASLPRLFAELEQRQIKIVSIPDVEADDVLATVVTRWLAEGRGEAIVVSTDKDLHALIAQGALIWDHFKNAWHDADWVRAKFGIGPELLPELLALMGDASDGIPGVRKVGMKTAARLLQRYGSLEGVMAGAGILKDTLGQHLRQDAAILALSHQLVALKCDVALGLTWNMLAQPAVQQ